MKKRQILVGDRLKLVALDKSHLPLRSDFINDTEVQSTLNFDYPTSLSKTEAWFSKVCLLSTRVELTIIDIETEIVIGFCGYINIDYKSSKAEHYIFIGNTDYWSKGYGSEAYKLLTNYGFQQLGLNRIYGYQLEGNTKAEKCTLKLGWNVEGLLRDDIFSHGEIKSRKVISMLRDEWLSNKMYD